MCGLLFGVGRGALGQFVTASQLCMDRASDIIRQDTLQDVLRDPRHIAMCHETNERVPPNRNREPPVQSQEYNTFSDDDCVRVRLKWGECTIHWTRVPSDRTDNFGQI